MYDRPPLFNRPLKNHWFGLRHGQSKANVEGLIVSDPAIGTLDYGLTKDGEALAIANLQETLTQYPQLDKRQVRIFSSDFIRARETALIAAETTATVFEVKYSQCLRERYFGRWDLTASSNYKKVWEADRDDPGHTGHDVESAVAVATRTVSLIESLERDYSKQIFFLVSHGDTLQILECVFRNLPVCSHRSLPALELAELRNLSGLHKTGEHA